MCFRMSWVIYKRRSELSLDKETKEQWAVQLGGAGVGKAGELPNLLRWPLASEIVLATRVWPETKDTTQTRGQLLRGLCFLLLKLKPFCKMRAVKNDGNCPGVGSALRFPNTLSPGDGQAEAARHKPQHE